jgi:hypothetical protein
VKRVAERLKHAKATFCWRFTTGQSSATAATRANVVVQLSHETDVGYELTTTLLVDGDGGRPLAMHLKTSEAMISTQNPAPNSSEHHLEQILPLMQASDGWGLSAPIVHVIDREADSVGHLRTWNEDGRHVWVRADDRRVLWRGELAFV